MVDRESVSDIGGTVAHNVSGMGESLISTDQGVYNVSGGDPVGETPDGPEAVTVNTNNTVDETPMAIRRLEQYFTDNEITTQSYVRTEDFEATNNDLRAQLASIQTHLDTATNSNKALDE
jgi:hypothetical protein